LAILPPGIVLLSTIANYTGPSRLDGYLAGYLFFVLILIAFTHIREREYQWFRSRTRYPHNLSQAVLRMGAIMALLVLSLSWVFPAGQDSDNWEQVQETLGRDPLEYLADLWNRLFPSLEGQGIATADYYGGDRLDLSGPIQLGDDPVMRVQLLQDVGDKRMYWRSTVFDTYDDGSWTHERRVRAYKDSKGMRFNIGDDAARREIDQTIALDIPATSLVYAAPQPVEMGLGVEAELNCVEGEGANCVNEGRVTDVALIRARKVLRAGDSYTVSSSISTASADQLRNASTQYPSWVLQAYLQGGDDVSVNLRALTEQIVLQSGALTPYDKAKAIENWLRLNITYNERIPFPPENGDPIDWFIFEYQEGYCNYFATAMVMMLRSQGIPARMAAGFSQGEYDPGKRIYTVIERDAHTWVEVFFPDYGWVEFEPTPDEPQVERPGDVPPSQTFPLITPIPSPTPTPLPTNTPPAQVTATPFPTNTPQATQTPFGTPPPQVTATPSGTPSLTPSPSPTITPSPTPNFEVETPLTDVATEDSGSDIWDTLLLILMIILIPLVILLVIGLLVIWWVEYRGLGGLSPVARAYARMGIYGRWLGIGLSSRLTPDEQRRRLVEEVPEGRPHINEISGLYTEERFGPPLRDEAAQYRMNQTARHSWTRARIAFINEKLRRWLKRR
jgi:transglutaminase-like putative cysteine protease